MDRDDARFVADVLERRIEGAAAQLMELRASSLVRLMGAAVRIREVGGDWPPAIIAAAELEEIAKFGAGVLEQPPSPLLPQFVETMRKLADEPAAKPNRAERRAKAAKLHRIERKGIILTGKPPIDVGKKLVGFHE